MPRPERMICHGCSTEFVIPDIWESVGRLVACPVCKKDWRVYVDEDGDHTYWFGLEEQIWN